MTEKFRWLSQSKASSLVVFLWTDSPFDDSGDWPEDLVIFAAVSEMAKNVGD
jgi:predicted Zn-dependent protease